MSRHRYTKQSDVRRSKTWRNRRRRSKHDSETVKRLNFPLEFLEPRHMLCGDPVSLSEDPTGSGYFVFATSEALTPGTDFKCYGFDALAGDRVVVVVDTPNGALNPSASLLNVSGGTLTSDNDGGPGNDSLLGPTTISSTGTYYARVAGQSGTLGEYDVRVEVLRGDVQVETDRDNDNATIASADVLTLHHSNGLAVANVVGNISADDAVADTDLFLIGRLNANVSVSLALTLPSFSELDGQIEVIDSTGALVIDEDGQLDFAGLFITPQADSYFARVSATSGAGSRGTYVLGVSVDDDVPPQIDSVVGLPGEGGTLDIVPNAFAIDFDEPIAGQTLQSNSFSLIAAGPDNQFDTPDDVDYNLVNEPPYTSGTRVSFTIDGGQAIAGNHRLRLNPSITDAAGNSLDGDGNGAGGDAFERIFTVTLPDGTAGAYENHNNATLASATPLTVATDPVGTGIHRVVGLGSQSVADSNVWADEDWWSFVADAGDQAVISLNAQGTGINAYIELYNPSGNFVTSDDNGGPGSDSLISGYVIPTSGVYYVRVGNWNAATGNYKLVVDLARGVAVETDAQYHNDTLSNADPVSFPSRNDATRVGSIAGIIQGTEGTNLDEDLFQLGVLNTGNLVSLSIRLPNASSLVPRLAILNSSGAVVTEEDPNNLTGTLTATVSENDVYYARVVAESGEGPDARYVLDVHIDDDVAPEITGVNRLPLPLADGTVYREAVLDQAPSVYLP
ncbi:MAG: PPC domain-containing protein, partial [Planctomycetales bacterium]|nr:PPC domain-containing protein [Planctomycetales bacterium]